MNIVEAYRSTLSELNQSHAASALIDDFNYFFFKSTDDYIEEVSKVFPLTQEIRDNLAPIVVEKKSDASLIIAANDLYTTTISAIANVSNTYRRMISVIVTSSKSDNSSLLVTKGAARLNEDQYSDFIDDAFDKPSPRKPYYKARKNITNGTWDLDIYNGNISVSEIDMVYFREPTVVKLTSDHLDMPISDARIPIIEFSDTVIKSIIKRVAAYMLENQSSQRTQSLVGLNQEPSLLPG